MKLAFDPSENERFWSAVKRIPGFPTGEEIPLKIMKIEAGALFHIPEVLATISGRSTGEALAVMDPTPMHRGAENLKPLILQTLRNAGWEPRPLVLEPDSSGQVHTDMPHIETVKAQILADVPVISIGSGVVTDIAKHACYIYDQENATHIPFLVYQTANSVSAFTSNMAPVFMEGVKRTLPSRYPDALVSDLETLRDAPREMTVAGVGDLVATFTSLADWHLAFVLGMAPDYQELPHTLMSNLDEIFLGSAEDIRNRSLPGMAVLAKLIHLAGLAVSLLHATTPLSGYEHVISHTLDMLNEQAGLPLAYHGSQVALATLLCSHAYQIFLNEFEPEEVRVEACYPAAERMKATILDEYSKVDPSGKAGEECWSDYQIKLEAWSDQSDRLEAFLVHWSKIQPQVRALTRPPETILKILKAVDAPIFFHELKPPVSEDAARFAFFNAPLIRRRLTLGDLLIFFQWDRLALWKRIWEKVST